MKNENTKTTATPYPLSAPVIRTRPFDVGSDSMISGVRRVDGESHRSVAS
jgi:hypothetical protein